MASYSYYLQQAIKKVFNWIAFDCFIVGGLTLANQNPYAIKLSSNPNLDLTHLNLAERK